jgi:hypothetical protein
VNNNALVNGDGGSDLLLFSSTVATASVYAQLEATVERGATSIQIFEEVNWAVGDEIAIASTSYNGREADRNRIKEIDRSNPAKPILHLETPLEFRHYAEDY